MDGCGKASPRLSHIGDLRHAVNLHSRFFTVYHRLEPPAFSPRMDVVTVHAKPPQRLLRKRKRLLDNVLFSHRAIGQTEPPEHADLSEDESNDSISRSAKRRKLKAEGTSVDSLPWKTITRPKSSGFDADVALMSLEEVDDVDIVYLDETKKRVSYNLLVGYGIIYAFFL